MYVKRKIEKKSKKTNKNKIKNTCKKSTITLIKQWEEANTDVSSSCQKYKYASQGNLIFVREKSGNCQGNLLCSNCGHPAEFGLLCEALRLIIVEG